MRPRWPRLASSRVARSDETFKTVSFSLIQSHSSRLPRGRDARSPPSRERRYAFVVTTHTTTVRAGAATAQWAFVAGWRSANPSRQRRREDRVRASQRTLVWQVARRFAPALAADIGDQHSVEASMILPAGVVGDAFTKLDGSRPRTSASLSPSPVGVVIEEQAVKWALKSHPWLLLYSAALPDLLPAL